MVATMPPKAKAAKQKPVAATTPPKQPTPDWPPLIPSIPTGSLALTSLLENQIITISNFWPSSLCAKYINFLRSLPLTTTPGKPKKGDAVRVNDRFQIDDPSFAEHLWSQTSLKSLVENAIVDGETLSEQAKKDLWGGEVLGLNPNIRIYRYVPGQFFDQHYDDSNNLAHPKGPARTTWTLLLYLTSPVTGCQGGETVFYPEAASKRDPTPEPVVAELEVGMALLHRHGKECMLHEGREVTSGEKWVIRSDLCVKR